MARSFGVYRSSDREFVRQAPTDDVSSKKFDDWLAQCVSRRLFDGELGNEHTVRVHWSEPASRLRLPLIASIYSEGFEHGNDWSGADLETLLVELETLAAYWRSEDLESNLLASLEERATGLRTAIGVAKEADAFLLIT